MAGSRLLQGREWEGSEGRDRNGRGVRGETEGERTGKMDQLLLHIVCMQQ